jgi:hypothetical protein
MITINLLPEERKKKQERFKKIDFSEFKLQDTAILGVAGSVFGVVVIVFAILFLATLFFKSDTKVLQNKYDAIADQKKDADALRAEVALINKKVKAIDELMVNRYSWAKKLDEINSLMIPGVWLSEISFDERSASPAMRTNILTKTSASKSGPRTLAISGYALNNSEEGNATIGKFMKSLKTDRDFYSDFSDIQLQHTKAEMILDQDVVSFRMTCFFKEKATK